MGRFEADSGWWVGGVNVAGLLGVQGLGWVWALGCVSG